MIRGFLFAFLLCSTPAFADRGSIENLDYIVHEVSNKVGIFSKIASTKFETTKEVGEPEHLVKSFLLKGHPENIDFKVELKEWGIFSNRMPHPVQKQVCRCEDPVLCECAKQKDSFHFDSLSYKKNHQMVTKHFVGHFRGEPITRVDLRLSSYDHQKNEMTVVQKATYQHNSKEFELEAFELRNYLIITPEAAFEGLADFIAWKESLGFTVHVEKILSPQNNKDSIKAMIRRYYDLGQADFVMLIGDENTIPMFYVRTDFSSQTPSDLYYFTMDSETDHIPDMFFSRVPASTAEEVQRELAKSIEFEDGTYSDTAGFSRVIGIASNEGSSPSDNEYILAIENALGAAHGLEKVHLYQNDSVKSNPQFLNQTLSTGSHWLFYMGHGDGFSWPNMNSRYSIANIKDMKNENAVKPIVIDVACQNGKVVSTHFGNSFLNSFSVDLGLPGGTTAYYGGTVNISWHPPAVMARAIGQLHASKNYAHLGQALFAGQMHLTGVWANTEQSKDNWEWYVLQGDPGLRIQR